MECVYAVKNEMEDTVEIIMLNKRPVNQWISNTAFYSIRSENDLKVCQKQKS